MGANLLVRKAIFSRRTFIRLVFGVKLVSPPSVQSYCEWGTLMFRFVMGKYIKPGDRVLEIGTGAHALLPIFLSKRMEEVSVVGTDILSERVALAQETVAQNNADVECIVANMFDGIAGDFDFIFFNPPAIPTGELAELGYESKSYPGVGERRCWSSDGGPDGLDLIRTFLNEVSGHLRPDGLAMIAANPRHCSREWFTEYCPQVGLRIHRIHRLVGVNNTYVLQCSPPAEGKTAELPPSSVKES